MDNHTWYEDEHGECDWEKSLDRAKEDLQKVQKIMALAPFYDDRMEDIANGSIVGEAYIRGLNQEEYIPEDHLTPFPILAWRDFYKSLKATVDEYLASGYSFDSDFLITVNKKAMLANAK
jgi:hypothetical protein